MRKVLFIIPLVLFFGSCVTTKNYNSLKAKTMRLEAELMYAESSLSGLKAENNELSKTNEQLRAEIGILNANIESLQNKYDRLLSDGSNEAAQMLRELQDNQREMEQLRLLLNSREESINSLRKNVADALLGFEGKGLSIAVKDSKVYVSMEEKLLFRSGSYEVEPEGARAIRDLAAVLAQNPDINIMVEGHTDNVPYRGSGNLVDNLDLSAKRATSVVRILLEKKDIDPVRIIAAARGDSTPVAAGDTSEARARNRRTEIILTPKLDELLQIMDR